MLEYQNIVLNNLQFKKICSEELSCNSFLFESSDELFLNTFSQCFAMFLLCNGKNKPCTVCENCKKVELNSHSDLKTYPKNHKNILVEDIKDIIDNIYLSGIESDKKIFILNNFSSATVQAQNKLLKILEEPPENAFIILNVTNISKVLPTILSRCKKIRLLCLQDDEIIKGLDLEVNRRQELLALANRSLSKAVLFYKDKNFWELYDFCLDTLKDMKDSKVLIKFSYKLSNNKEEINTILEIFESLFRDMLFIRLKTFSLVKNKTILIDLQSISLEFNCDAIDLIIKKIYEIKKKLEFNCNYVYLIDSLLLYVLEVKFLCNKN